MCSVNSESLILVQTEHLDVPKMEETIATKKKFREETLSEMYLKVIAEANKCYHKKGFIKCSKCGEEILMIPTLSKMNEAIENHVRIHKESIEDNSILKQNTAMHVRLDLVHQVLQEASDSFRLF